MPRVDADTIIHARPARVAALYREWRGWPTLFPATIRGVRLVREEPGRTVVEVDHRTAGRVVNVLRDVSDEEIELEEFKPRYDATFVNRFEPVPAGTRYLVRADIRLRGAFRLLGPLLGGYTRRQVRRYVLDPMRRAAEAAPPRESEARPPAG